MAQPEDRSIVMFDAAGQVTDDASLAVRGEIIETLPDGALKSTLFEVDAEAVR